MGWTSKWLTRLNVLINAEILQNRRILSSDVSYGQTTTLGGQNSEFAQDFTELLNKIKQEWVNKEWINKEWLGIDLRVWDDERLDTIAVDGLINVEG